MAQKRYPEAQALFQRSLEVRQKVLGHFHPELSAVHNAIGNLHECQKDLTGAIAHYNVALQLNRKVPTLHPYIVIYLFICSSLVFIYLLFFFCFICSYLLFIMAFLKWFKMFFF
jgi:tetratricopeptide (TPR) repeat protein